MSAQTDRYDNPETAQKLEEARKELEQREQAEQVESAASSIETRNEIASEEQPDPNAPDLRETYEIDFRGHAFEFYELGDTAIKAAQFAQGDEDDVEAGSKAADFVYETLGEKAVNDACGESYWRRYDFDDVMDLFFDLADKASDLDEEQREQIDEFRGDR